MQTWDKCQNNRGDQTQMKKIGTLLAACFVVFAAAGFFGPFKEKGKVAIILQADTDRHEGLARAVHALLYAKELAESGYEVRLIFDGAGTRWAEELTRPEGKSPLIPQYNELKDLGIVQVVCDFCANAFDVKKELKQRKMKLEGDYHGHPSLAQLLKKGYRLIVL